MKNIIKYAFITAILCATTIINSQTLGIRAGLSLPRVAVEIQGQDKSDQLETKLGFLIGMSLQIPLNPIFNIETGLQLANKGYKETEDEEPGFKYVETFNPYYLEIPIKLRAGFDIGGPRLLIQAGPYIAMGIAGSIKQEYTESGQTETSTHDIEWGSENGQVSLFDFGLNIGAGLEFNNFQVVLSYGLGLTNLANFDGTNSDNYLKNRVLGLTFGYNFNKKDIE